MKSIKGIISDFDGVISNNSLPILIDYMYDAINQFTPISRKKITDIYKVLNSFPADETSFTILKALGLNELQMSIIFKKIKKLDAYKGNKVTIEEGFLNLLSFCKEKDIEFKIITASGIERIRNLVVPKLENTLLIKDHFIEIHHRSKSDPFTYNYVIDKFGINPTEWLFIDDDPFILQVAALSGFRTVLIDNPKFSFNDDEELNPYVEMKFKTLNELISVLKETHEIVRNNFYQNEKVNKSKIINAIFNNMLTNSVEEHLDLLDDDSIFVVPGNSKIIPFAGIYSGKSEVKLFFEKISKAIKLDAVNIDYQLFSCRYVNSHVRLEGSIIKNNKHFNLEFIFAWEFNHKGYISKCDLYYCTFSMAQAFSSEGPKYIEDIRSFLEPVHLMPISINPLDLVTKGYLFLDQKNINGLMEFLADDVIWSLKGAVGVTKYAGRFLNKDGVFDFFNSAFNSFDYVGKMKFTKIITDKNIVNVHFNEVVKSKITGKIHDISCVHNFRINSNKKIAEFKSYNDSYEVYLSYLVEPHDLVESI